MEYQNNSTTETANGNLQLNCNGLDIQNTGNTVAYFDGIYIGPGTGKVFPVEVAGKLAKYEKLVNITFTGGAGTLIVNQISYLNK